MAHLGAGNRDPAVFSDPEQLDITRNPNRHLGFGHGPHACLGAPFARSEVPIALGLFLRHCPDYEIDAPEIEFPNHSLRGPQRLPLKF
jgi:cytochrome P450